MIVPSQLPLFPEFNIWSYRKRKLFYLISPKLIYSYLIQIKEKQVTSRFPFLFSHTFKRLNLLSPVAFRVCMRETESVNQPKISHWKHFSQMYSIVLFWVLTKIFNENLKWDFKSSWNLVNFQNEWMHIIPHSEKHLLTVTNIIRLDNSIVKMQCYLSPCGSPSLIFNPRILLLELA